MAKFQKFNFWMELGGLFAWLVSPKYRKEIRKADALHQRRYEEGN